MKRILCFLFTLLIVASLSITAFAAPNMTNLLGNVADAENIVPTTDQSVRNRWWWWCPGYPNNMKAQYRVEDRQRADGSVGKVYVADHSSQSNTSFTTIKLDASRLMPDTDYALYANLMVTGNVAGSYRGQGSWISISGDGFSAECRPIGGGEKDKWNTAVCFFTTPEQLSGTISVGWHFGATGGIAYAYGFGVSTYAEWAEYKESLYPEDEEPEKKPESPSSVAPIESQPENEPEPITSESVPVESYVSSTEPADSSDKIKAPSNSSPSPKNDNRGLLIGIVVATVAFLCAAGITVYFVIRKKGIKK